MSTNTSRTIALDVGAGNIKLYSEYGGTILASHVATPQGTGVAAAGLGAGTPPMMISSGGWDLYTGADAHTWGRPVEDLSDARWLTGAPPIRALVYGALSQHRVAEEEIEEIDLIVGLPQSALLASEAERVTTSMRRWLTGAHNWISANGHAPQQRSIYVREVKFTTQTAGALFDYLLNSDGKFIADRQAAAYLNEVGIISVGMNDLELQVTVGNERRQALSASETCGVRRLLELADPEHHYSRGELDYLLRRGMLDVDSVVGVWSAEVLGHIERVWARKWRRFAAIIGVGGGIDPLYRDLMTAFGGRITIAPDPILAIARGLHKLAKRQGA